MSLQVQAQPPGKRADRRGSDSPITRDTLLTHAHRERDRVLDSEAQRDGILGRRLLLRRVDLTSRFAFLASGLLRRSCLGPSLSLGLGGRTCTEQRFQLACRELNWLIEEM